MRTPLGSMNLGLPTPTVPALSLSPPPLAMASPSHIIHAPTAGALQGKARPGRTRPTGLARPKVEVEFKPK